jgi:hypothetical protein
MKTNAKIYVAVALLCLATAESHSQGYIIPNGVTEIQTGSWPLFRVLQNPTNGDYTAFAFIPEVGNTFSFSELLDEGVRVFLVEADDPISVQAIQSGSYMEFTSSGTATFQIGLPFYVGLYTGYGFTGTYTDPVFGWAQLVNNNGNVHLLDSALAANAPGIYAGTPTIIPEPSMFSLFGLGTLLLGWHFQRKTPG